MSTAVVTNAVVANCVLLSPAVAVGADGVPVNVGPAIFAFRFIWSCILPFTPLKCPNSVSVIELTATFPFKLLIKTLDDVRSDETIVDAAPVIVVPPLDVGLSIHSKLPLLYSKICPLVGAVVHSKLYLERPGEALLTGTLTSLAVVIIWNGCSHDNSPVAFVFK